ncbi:MAG: glycoside hydrolase family 5 protein [Candidatus Omnitrophica bacterium]|nr:glycoside hydrolase family 5 protein [Candidatus Omnitrophota bacterium]
MMVVKKVKGVNLGSWLLMEGYILGGRNIPEHIFKRRFKSLYGQKELERFQTFFRDNYITEADFKNIADMQASVVRLPFNCRLIEPKPNRYSEKGFSYLAKAFSWAKKYNLGIILDLHAAAGAQNYDWHSDSDGRAGLWEKEAYRQRTYRLWEKLSQRFKDEPALAGYDLLNEPVLGKVPPKNLVNFYSQVIKRIRQIDKKHTIYIEGDNWAQEIDFLSGLISENVAISIHTYLPLSYTFNFNRFSKFPGKIEGLAWDKKRIYKYLEPYYKFSLKNKVKIFVGEFGINWRGGCWGELDWLEGMLSAFESFGFEYTYWTYKAVSQACFPDGLYQYLDNSRFVQREGPEYGWETYFKQWSKNKKAMVDFWKTENYRPNQKIISRLKEYFKK